MSELQNNTGEKLLILNDDLFFGSGRHKKCYLHPTKDTLCVKIAYNRGGQTDLLREINYIKILKKRNKNYDILPKYYGEIETNLGHGYVFEVIRNYDKSKSITLQEILLDEKLFDNYFNLTVKLLKDLKNNLFENEIITMGIFPENIIFQQIAHQTYKVRIVNDMGSGVLIPLEYHFHYFAKAKVARRWEEFLTNLKKLYPSELTNKLISLIV